VPVAHSSRQRTLVVLRLTASADRVFAGCLSNKVRMRPRFKAATALEQQAQVAARWCCTQRKRMPHGAVHAAACGSYGFDMHGHCPQAQRWQCPESVQHVTVLHCTVRGLQHNPTHCQRCRLQEQSVGSVLVCSRFERMWGALCAHTGRVSPAAAALAAWVKQPRVHWGCSWRLRFPYSHQQQQVSQAAGRLARGHLSQY
jgi:hypothetical protein